MSCVGLNSKPWPQELAAPQTGAPAVPEHVLRFLSVSAELPVVSDRMLLFFRTTPATCASVPISQARQSDVLRAEDHEEGEGIWCGGRED